MGLSGSRLDRTLTSLPDGERYFGLENFGNTCYCNSVLQALYFCQPFREGILKCAATLEKDCEDNVFTCLVDFFQQVNTQKKKSGVISPRKIVHRVKKDSEQFCGYMHQDAHEFLNFLLRQVTDKLEREQRLSEGLGPNDPVTTWVQDIFEGKEVNEIRCFQCETTTSHDEVFMDLQLAIEHNCSLTACIKKYSAKTMLTKDDKYFCEVCQCYQEAQRCNKIKKLPEILICQFKRFDLRMQKLMHRVVFPMELKLCNTTDDTPDSDFVYNLFAVVVHSGSSLDHGHYVSLVKSHGHWLLFDDDQVEPIPEVCVERTFGSAAQYGKNTDRGYILFYEKSANRSIHPCPSPTQSGDVVSGDTNSTATQKGQKHQESVESESGAMLIDQGAMGSLGSIGKLDTALSGGSDSLGSDSIYKRLMRAASWWKSSKTMASMGNSESSLVSKSARGSRSARSIPG